MIEAIQGAKSGEKKQRQPVIQSDNLQSIAQCKMLYAVGEGEVFGLVDGLRSVKLDGTPLMSANGSLNFQDVQFDFRSGTVEQEHIAGFPEINNETSVNIELRSDNPFIRAINNIDIDAVRIRFSWSALQQQQTNGDITGYRINYAIEVSTDGGPYVTKLETAVNGKTTSNYQRSHRIDLDPATTGWQIRVRRLTANANSSLIADTMYVDALTEIIDAKLRYPNTALAGVQFNAEQFSNIPKFSVEIYGRILKVPSNYDPETRTYTGVWDGSFKLAYTNNPAWVWYDLVLNTRYGLGKRINESLVNKWELYRIAQYCDVMVSDGNGGLEPRFTCNICIQQQQEAYTVLSDLASIFHGMSYWNGNQLVCIADMPSDPAISYSRANIVDGMINYSGTSRKDRHSLAMVSWDDPNNSYQTKKEPVSNQNAIAKIGVQPIETAAFGCTSVGQAIRAGKWALETEQRETRTATFRVGLDGSLPRPGEVVRLSDSLLAGRVNGGRIKSATTRQITIDQVAVVRIGDTFTVNLPSGKSESRIVQSVNGRIITLTSDYSELPKPDAIWVVDSEDLSTLLMRVIAITRPEMHQFEITAVQHAPEKYTVIDTSAVIDERPVTVIPPSVQESPTNVRITQNISVEQGLAVTNMTIAWDAAPNAIAYRVEWRRDSLQYITEPTTGSLSIDIKGVYSGNYVARVYAINALGAVSLPASSVLTAIEGKTGAPPVPAFFTATSILFGIRLDWGFPQDAEDTSYTEIQYSETADGQNPATLGNYTYPQHSFDHNNLSAGKRLYYRARLVDRTGNIGAWTSWIAGIASNDAGLILDAIKGQITESQLGQSLLEKIESGGGADVKIEKVINDLAAMYTIKTQITEGDRTYIAGIGVGVENNEGIIESQVLVAADRFAVIHPNGTEVSIPFVIQDGNVYISSAFIQDATITMAKIAGALQSDDYIPQVSGWRITKEGSFEVNGSNEGGRRLDTATKTLIHYPNGQLAVALGIDI